MKAYIDKAAVVAEIEKRKQTWQHQDQQYTNGGKDVCDYLLGFLDTLEVKDIQEEPVSEDLEEAARKYARKQVANPDYPTYNDEYEMVCAFEAGAQWQKSKDEPSTEDLEEESKKYSSCIYLEEVLSDDDIEVLKEKLINTFKAGALWQKEQMIDKACEWLENLFAPDGSIIPENIKRIEDFKNYMK